jgi:CheY-like chemotaxis protein
MAMAFRSSGEKPWGILVVDDNLTTLRPVLDLLRASGYSVSGAMHLETAVGLVRAIPFDLMIVGIHPRSDSGLQLIRLARGQQPGMSVMAVMSFPDADTEEEFARLGVTTLVTPLDVAPLLELVADKVSDLSRRRRWGRKHILGGFAARVGGHAAKVVEMSYGGFRLEMPAPPGSSLPAPVEVTLLSFGLSVNATLVWSRTLDDPGPWTCGAALRDTDESATRAWRVVVDALPDWVRPASQPAAGM